MRLRASELRSKDVVNTADGRKLGALYDLDIDLESGRVRALVLPVGARPFSFWSRERDVEILWESIVKIGVDVILVEIPASVSPRI